MSFAVDATNDGFEKYNFPQATTALHNFWLYELCDVYLEYLKPIFQCGAADSVLTARHVLTICLDTGLRLISPFMPFISEELYQRIPGQKEHPSISVSSYPTKQGNKV
jgi:valyl-tRNA synthetase